MYKRVLDYRDLNYRSPGNTGITYRVNNRNVLHVGILFLFKKSAVVVVVLVGLSNLRISFFNK